MSALKLCKDCKYINQCEQCECPTIPLLDLVNGRHHVFYCAVARANIHLCGPDAKYFEARS
jgi:hypothetical protein